jgi:3-phenylpropionate/trans-cinnamate dioxygenase ferredoxin subunit
MTLLEPQEESPGEAAPASRYVRLGPADELVDGQMRVSVVAGREIGVVRWEGELYAVRNICPHRGAPVCTGVVRPTLDTDAGGSLRVVKDRPILICGWHRWEFDLRTGKALKDSLKLRTYPVSVGSDGEVVVDVRSRA